MSDTRNVMLAWASSITTIFTTHGFAGLLSAIVLPVALFALGKTVDVLVQIYLQRAREESDDPLQKPTSPTPALQKPARSKGTDSDAPKEN